jgi:hypothetical protein
MSASTLAATPPALPALRASPASLLLRLLGSMKLSVWLLLLLALQTWLGTFAQSWKSIEDVQRDYFESWWLIGEWPISFWGTPLWPDENNQPWRLRIPMPGAYPVMGLLLVNLVVGGICRMRWQARNVGILITHFGIVFLLAAGFVKLSYGYAGFLGVFETPADGNVLPGRVYETTRFVSGHEDELVLLVDRGETTEERVIPEHHLWGARGSGVVTVRGEGLPFSLQVSHWVDHSRVAPKGPMVKTLMPVVDGAFLESIAWPPGEQPQSSSEYSGCYVKMLPAGGMPAEAILRSSRLEPFDRTRYPWTFSVQGQRYGLELRRVTRDLPFSVRLDKFQKRDHPGTLSPMDFRSRVTARDGSGTQPAEIFMNNPLRRDGFVLYQSNWGPQPMGGPPWYSILEVKYDPSDVWPMLACFVIFAGLATHFVLKLLRFLDSSTRTSLQA